MNGLALDRCKCADALCLALLHATPTSAAHALEVIADEGARMGASRDTRSENRGGPTLQNSYYCS